MNAELLGIITVGIILLGVGVAVVAQSDAINIEIGDNIIPKQITSSTRTDFQQYCDIIPAACG